jgi:hypothetical protein
MPLIRKKRNDDEPQLGSIYDGTWPPPGYGGGSPQPERRRMPAGWKPSPSEEFDYLLIREDFLIGARSFRRGQDVIRRNDPLALKVFYENPELVNPVRLDKED